jgi:hypothetical protein
VQGWRFLLLSISAQQSAGANMTNISNSRWLGDMVEVAAELVIILISELVSGLLEGLIDF